MVNKNKKRVARAGTVLLGAALPFLLSAPAAHAARRDDGDDPGAGLSVVETLGYFVLAPLALFALIALLVVLGEKSGSRQDA